jgi:tripartite motif-containing protein 71
MAVKKTARTKGAAKKRKPARRQAKGRGRRVLMMLAVLGVLVAGVAALMLLNRQEAEVPVVATVALTAGSHGAAPGTLDSPRGLAVAPNGDVYVADLSNGRVSIFGGDGKFKATLGHLGAEPGKGKPGEFNEPSGVAVGPDGTVYVADAWNGRIQKFDAKGKVLGEYGGVRYSFYSPRNVAVDKAGNLYVADTGNSAVKVIDPSGKLLRVLGGRGSGGGKFNEVFGVAVNSRGEVFVADPGNKRIHKFSASGDFLKDRKVAGWQTAAPFWPMLAVDGQDRVWAVDGGNRKLWAYDSDLKYLGTLGGGQGADLFSAPLGLGFAADGSLWVSDMAANKLLKLNPPTVPAPTR